MAHNLTSQACAALFLATAFAGNAVAADLAPLPDPATVSIPDVNAKPGPRDPVDTDETFFFHKPNAPFALALADYQTCNSLVANIEIFSPPPPFVPIGTDIVPNTGDASAAVDRMFGLVGLIIVGMTHDDDVKTWQRLNLRRCMNYKGYQRYATTKSVWTAINQGTPAEVVTRLALIASGPQPATGALAP